MKDGGYLELKAELLTEGVQADAAALEGVGTRYKEQNHGLFGWDFENHVEMTLPDDFTLPDGTVVQFRQNSRSPYRITAQNGGQAVTRGEEELCGVTWIPRPAFYRGTTGAGRQMVKVGQIGGEDCLFFCYQNYCSHFSRHEECLFCNLVATVDTYESVERKKEIGDIGEVAAAAFAEGMAQHVLLTGGCFSPQKELDLVAAIIDSIRDHTGRDRIPGTILPSPAKSTDVIKRYYETGIQAIGFSMEIWDEPLYRAICPGKSAGTTHREFVDAIETAVSVFGAGNVYTVLVMGLEPRDTFLEGVRTVTGLGANVVPFVWAPNPGSKLADHRAPSSKWYVETISQAAEIVEKAQLPPGTENHCYRCDGNSLLHDALRLRGIA